MSVEPEGRIQVFAQPLRIFLLLPPHLGIGMDAMTHLNHVPLCFFMPARIRAYNAVQASLVAAWVAQTVSAK